MAKASTKKRTKNNNGKHIQCVWGLVCSMSSIDPERNNISLFNVIDQLNIPKKNFEEAKEQEKKGILVGMEHEIILFWRRLLHQELCDEPLDVETNITLIDPNGNVLYEILQPIRFESKRRGLRFRIQQNAFKITMAGDYVYQINVKQPNSERFTKAFEIPLQVLEV